MDLLTQPEVATGATANKLAPEDAPIHNWYRFVLSYPPHVVRTYVDRFGLDSRHRVLDPFSGTGTTLVECKKLGLPSAGIEANPVAHLASQVKVDWGPDPNGLREHASLVEAVARSELARSGLEDMPGFGTHRDAVGASTHLRDLPPDARALLLTNSISPLPLHKALVLLGAINDYCDERYHRHEVLALIKAVVYGASNLKFGPEVGVGPAKSDAPVIAMWIANVRLIARDLARFASGAGVPSQPHLGDARQSSLYMEPTSIDAVITSPPYPNEKDYTRTTRLETVLLGLVAGRDELRALKRGLIRSNTRGVYRGDDDDAWVAHHDSIQRLAAEIERRRLELGKTSGFERLYPRVTKLDFGGMARHLADLRQVLRPGRTSRTSSEIMPRICAS